MGRWRHEATYNVEIAAAHRQYPSVPVSIIQAVIAAESGFQKDAYRAEPQIGDASIGLMQVLHRTAEGLGFAGTPDQLRTPAVNIVYGTKLLAQNLAATGNWPDAISAYNGGIRPHLGFGKKALAPTNVCLRWSQTIKGKCEQWKTVPPGEYANQAYVDKVLANVRYFEAQAEGEQRRPFRIMTAGAAPVAVPALLLTLGLGLALLRRRR